VLVVKAFRFSKCWEAKSNLTNELEVEFEDGMECEEFPKLGDMIYLPHYKINDNTCCYIFIKGMFSCFKL